MAKTSWNDYSATPGSNTDIDSVDIDEGCAPSGINNAIREIMAHTADVVSGTVALSSINIDGGSITGITDLAIGDGGTGASTASAALANLGGAATASVQTFTAGQRAEITTLTDGATITPDMDDSNNFVVTLGGNRTMANPSNLTAGQSGSIFIIQDGTGSRTLSFGSYYDFAGGTAPTLSTDASAVDRIDYVVRSTTSIHCVFTANYS